MYSIIRNIISTYYLGGKMVDAHTIISLIAINYPIFYENMSVGFKTTAIYHSYISKQIKKIAVSMHIRKVHTLNINGNCSANALYNL
jgi:aryl-phospho-beta-D-glucosidase BglC (GH1 family)